MASPDPDALPDEAFVAALSALDGMGPARLRATLDRWPANDAWDRLASQRGHTDRSYLVAIGVPGLVERWERLASTWSVGRIWDLYQQAGVGVSGLGSPGFPQALRDDPEPPAVLFHHGSPDALAARRVAVVGTRRCTRYGHDVAFEVGRELARAGVAVVSGLALGIDAAAHAGALSVDGAPPVAVVGTGLDVVYPRRNAALWADVRRRGVVYSEAPLGARPERWRFPARNRIIAGLADIVVVAESHLRGGSMHTVLEAAARSVDVMAVPGPIRSSASLGTNRLLAEGCVPLNGVDDVLMALGLQCAEPTVDRRPPPDGDGQLVLDALDWRPATLDQVIARTGLAVGDAAVAVERLRVAGWLAGRGAWLERVARA